MPVNLNRLDVGGLASLAGHTIGNLNLPLFGVDSGAYDRNRAESLFKMAQMQNAAGISDRNNQAALIAQAMQGQNNLDQQAMQGQNQLAVNAQQGDTARTIAGLDNVNRLQLANINNYSQEKMSNKSLNSQMALEQLRLGGAAQEGNLNRQQAMALAGMDDATKRDLGSAQITQDDKRIQLEQQRMQNEQFAMALKARSQLDSDQRNLRGASSSAILQFMNSPSYAQLTPEQQQASLIKMQEMFIKKGVYSPEEAQQFLSSSPQEQQASLLMDVGLSSAATKLATDKAFSQTTNGANGSFAKPSASTLAKSEQDIQTGIDLLQKGQDLIKTNDPIYYGTGLATTALGKIQGLIGYNGEADKLDDAKEAYFAKAQSYASSLLKLMDANVTARTIKLAEPMMITGKEEDMGSANAKLQALQEAGQAFIKSKQLAMTQGIPLDNTALQSQLEQISNKYGISKKSEGEKTYTLPGVATNIKESDLNTIAKANKMTVDELKQHLKSE